MIHRVAFSGAPGSGKSTHARLLQQKWGGDVLSFATPLKKLVANVFTAEQLTDPVFARRAYQLLGSDIRSLDPDYWIRSLTAKVSTTRNVFVDDCRYYNEYVALRALGFRFIRLTADSKTLQERRPGLSAAELHHQAETEHLYFPAYRYYDTSLLPVENTHAILCSDLLDAQGA